MSIDVLQKKIRKTKCPVMLELSASLSELPAQILSDSPAAGYARVCREVMDGLKGSIPAVRFGFSSFALLGADGVAQLAALMRYAKKLGYYVALDAPEILSQRSAQRTADVIFGENSPFPCDGLTLLCYLGSDCIKPFLEGCKTGNKDIFLAVRTANRTAPELQDLRSGTRLVHIAGADLVSRCADGLTGKCGYSPVGIMSAANAPDSLRALREKYPRLFLLVDDYGAVGANAKNCACAFDKFGHGAIVCDGGTILRAWQQAESDGSDYVTQAELCVERMKRNFARYITIL